MELQLDVFCCTEAFLDSVEKVLECEGVLVYGGYDKTEVGFGMGTEQGAHHTHCEFMGPGKEGIVIAGGIVVAVPAGIKEEQGRTKVDGDAVKAGTTCEVTPLLECGHGLGTGSSV